MTDRADALLEGLNPPQRQAVQCVDGPLLIVAGPGSGKTRVITHRIAYLNRHVGISPWRIAAVTFTNRAAREMRNRLAALMGDGAQRLTAGTFHALCASVLRRDGEVIGIPPDYVIMDDEDQMNLIKQSMVQLELNPKLFPPRSLLSAISRAKSQLLGPDALAAKADSRYEKLVAQVFAAYQASLARSHGVDFDDLLGKAVELFLHSPEVRDRWQERFIHFMVDEFQDTNTAQYEIARLLAGKHRNLAVVGDPDQSIYSWRNADIRNILSFKKDYPDATVVALSQNYRSTRTILEASRHVIRANSQRIEQELFTENDQGVLISIVSTSTEEEEARQVLGEVQRLMEKESVPLRDCVVTYRVNAQSRALEEACLRYGVPYKIVGGVRFYQRREVKDLICYLRLLQNPYDEVSLTRVINVPTRGIGKRTVDELLALANARDIPAYTMLQLLAEEVDYPSPFDLRRKHQLTNFLGLLNGLGSLMPKMELPQLVDEVLEQSGMRPAIRESDDPNLEDRLENLRELRGLSAEFAGTPAEEGLPAFLERIALVSDQDVLDDDEQQYLTLITLHQIKGLEFPVVFITGMEDGVLPHMRSIDDRDQLEEERRIAYVGMTRARERLYFFCSRRRRMFGFPGPALKSRFLRDIPFDLTEAPERGQRYGDGGMRRQERERAAVGADGVPVQAPPFKTGEKVMHLDFGLGIVVDCRPRPSDYEVRVAFRGNQGIKHILHSYGKLERVQRS